MPSSLRTPKTLSQWLDLDSPLGRRPFRLFGWEIPAARLWRWLLLAPLLVGVLLVVAWFAWPASGVAVQAGPLSASHRMFNQDCNLCHTGSFQTVHRLWRLDGSVTSVSDQACSKCHAGPPHHPAELRAGLGGTPCAACHREHHGGPALARVADEHCLSCHRDLKESVKPGAEVHYADVAGWASHPPFARRWEGAPEDPGTIAFNHKVHLDPEGVFMPDPKQQSRPAGGLPRKKLECGTCHQPDEAGRYIKPISYEVHCKECHPLSVQLTAAGRGPAAPDALRRFREEPAPHRAPEVVRAALRDRLTEFIQANSNEFLGVTEKVEVPRPIPGAWPTPPPVTKEQFAFVNRQLAEAEKQLFNNRGGCQYCHREEHPEKRNAGGLPVYAPARINQRTFPLLGSSSRWFPHSRFGHNSHRMLLCTECHEGARGSEKTSDVLLPDIGTCRRCHEGPPAAGARSDCVECHTYHPRTEVERFRGSLTIGDCTGTRKRD
jgi:hypothetical protein